ncbi:MAG: potassium channel protein [Aureliella sp.]
MGVCAVTCLFALLSYMAAGWGPLDSAYMVVITIFGIGYGEVYPIDDPMLKVQTMALIIVGCLSGLYSCGGFIQLVTEGEIKRALGVGRNNRGIRRMKNHAIICGFGRVGKMLADKLVEDEIPCVIIDNDERRLEQAELAGLAVVCGDASCDETLLQAGIGKARTLASVLPNDAVNVFITLTARDLNQHIDIIARAESPTTEYKLRRSGANHVVLPAAIGALRMAEIIRDLPPIQPAGRKGESAAFQLEQLTVADTFELEDQTLADAMQILSDLGEVVGVQRGKSQLVTQLDETLELRSDDILLLAKH